MERAMTWLVLQSRYCSALRSALPFAACWGGGLIEKMLTARRVWVGGWEVSQKGPLLLAWVWPRGEDLFSARRGRPGREDFCRRRRNATSTL
eukprot:296838-Chlamydomonas_euryale.AAC.3